MRKTYITLLVLLLSFSGVASAQYSTDSPSGPWFGGPGNYEYPIVCGQCRVWQDYRNFAWNQLTINGGDFRTPNNPRHHTVFRIYSDPANDRYAVTVEISLEIVDVEIMGHDVGHDIAEPEHFFVETHPDNGDRVPVAYYPKNQGLLLFPYVPLDDDSNNDSSSGGTPPGSSGGGGDSSGGGSGGGWGGGGGGAGAGGGSGGPGHGGGGTYCGPGTDWHCVQL